MISTKDSISPTSVANSSNNSFRHQKMIKQFAQTLIFIVLIFVASFFRDTIKQEKIRKKERAELAAQIARQNYLLEQERFMEGHREFLSTFLQYENHCNKIHALIYKNPNGVEKVTDLKHFNCHKHCKGGNRKSPVRIQMGDRTPLDFALVYVFLASLMFLFVRAIIDVSKEFNAPHNKTNEKTSSLHAYASSKANANTSRRCSNTTTTTPQTTVSQHKRDSTKFTRVSISSTSDPHQQATECPPSIISNETCKSEASTKTGFDRRSSVPVTQMAHNLLKETIDVQLRRQSFEAFSEEEELCGSDGKKHRLIRR